MHIKHQKRVYVAKRIESLESRYLMHVGAEMVVNVVPGSYSLAPEQLTATDVGVFFVANHPTFGSELWMSRGTEGSTHRVTDLIVGPTGSMPHELTSIGEHILFVAQDEQHGEGLWISDGQSVGTSLVADLSDGNNASSLHSLTRVDKNVFFVVSHFNRDQLWVTDGNPEGTRVVADFEVQSDADRVRNLTPLDSMVLFTVGDALHGTELWRSDATSSGTKLVRDIQPGELGAEPSRLTAIGRLIYFAADDGIHGIEPWVTDGTVNGTRLLRDVRSGPLGSRPEQFVATATSLFFSADNGVSGRQLWALGREGDNAPFVLDIAQEGSGGAYPRELTVAGGSLFFTAVTEHDEALWTSDGTSDGTRPLGANANIDAPRQLRVAGDKLYFTAEGEGIGRELWELSLQNEVVSLTRDINPGLRESGIAGQVVWHNALFFSADDGYNGRELWTAGEAYSQPGLLELLNAVRANFGEHVLEGTNGDWNGDGYVDLADLALARSGGVVSTGTHGNSELNNEHVAVFQLVDPSLATHRALRSGSWSDPSIWQTGIPHHSARVIIGVDVVVTVDDIIDDRLQTLRVDGTLRFSTNVTTSLRVDTLVVSPTGTLEIGTVAQPVSSDVTASIIIDGDSPIERSSDPLALGRGIVSHGRVSIQGIEKTGFTTLAESAVRGQEWLTLDAVPQDWRLGDQLLLPGTNPVADEDEQLTLLAVTRSAVRVRPLRFNHFAPATDLKVHLANLTRNVVVSSADTSDPAQRGHVMFMHSANVNISYARFDDLGRTDKRIPINDAKLDIFGRLIDGTGSNVRGRYAVHFHRTGTATDRATASIKGSVVVGSPGWGIVNHSSKVEIDDNIVFDVVGAAFATEVGDEVGTFRHNLAVRSHGSGEKIYDRYFNQDFGHEGIGFWFQGGGVVVSDNVAVGHPEAGYFYATIGLVEEGLGRGRFLSENLPNPSWARGDTVDVRFVPLMGFRQNTAYAAGRGLEMYRHLEKRPPHELTSTVDRFLAWNIGVVGIQFDYTKHVIVREARLFNDVSGMMVPAERGYAIKSNKDSGSIDILDSMIKGWKVGVDLPPRGHSHVSGGMLANVYNLLVQKPWEAPRTVEISGVSFGRLTSEDLRGWRQWDLYPNPDQDPYVMVRQQFYAFDTATSLGPNVVLLDGQQVFMPAQLPGAVQFDSYDYGNHIPPQLLGRSNLELWEQYGVAVGGAPPIDALVERDYVFGWLGTPATQLPDLQLLSEQFTGQMRGYRVRYRFMDETVEEPDSVNLERGWNLLCRFIGGHWRSMFVFGIGDAGDTNGDRVVDLQDLNAVRDNFGMSGAHILGDVNDDGFVNLDDLNLVRANFGASAAADIRIENTQAVTRTRWSSDYPPSVDEQCVELLSHSFKGLAVATGTGTPLMQGLPAHLVEDNVHPASSKSRLSNKYDTAVDVSRDVTGKRQGNSPRYLTFDLVFTAIGAEASPAGAKPRRSPWRAR